MNTVQTKAKRKPRQTKVRHLNVRRVVNPFEPFRGVETEQWVWKKRKPLSAYLPAGLADDYVVSCNGAVVEPENLANMFPQADDFIVLCPIPRGGGGDGGGKMIFRMIAMVVIAVAAAYTGGAAAAAYGPGLAGATGVSVATASAMISAAVTVSVTVAGSLLLNAILPPAAATNTGSSLANSASYGADGAKNTSAEGIPYPVSYGQFRMAGNIIGLYTELNTSGTDASNNGNNQILYMLVNAGEGPIASITDVLINDRVAEDFQELTLQQRMGYGAQAPIDWFSKVITPVNHNVMLPSKGDFVTFTTVEACEQFRIDFACPLGLYAVNTTTGAVESNTVAIEADYRAIGATDWIGLGPSATVYQEVDIVPVFPGVSGSPDNDPTVIISAISVTMPNGDLNVPASAVAEAHSKYDQFIGKPIGDWPVSFGGTARIAISSTTTTGNITITDNLRATVRRSFDSPQVPLAKYEIRIRRNVDYAITTVNNFTNIVLSSFPTDTSDTAESDTYVTDINEITFDGVAYNNTALLALRVQMDSQLSGVPNVTFLHGGKLINVISRVDGNLVTSLLPSSNPAWIWYDMTTNQVYGAAIDASRIDLDSVIAWAQYCDAEGLVWNGPLDQVMTFWDAAALVMRVGHAQVMQIGTRYYVTTEAPADPVMMFGMGNIVKDSFKMTWLGMKDRATEVDVTYFDASDYNKSKTVKVQDSTLALNAAQQNVSAVTMFGVTDIKTAYKEGAFALNLNRYLTQSVEFDAPIEAIACTPGDVILVQHDMPNWAYSGRLDAGSTLTTLALDKPVTMEAGKTYKALLLTDTVTRYSGRIQNVHTNFVQIVGGLNLTARAMRIRAGNGAEAAITTAVSDGVYVDDSTGFVAGDTVTLVDTDVVTDMNIVNQPGETDTLLMQVPLTYVPGQFTNYIFGETAKVRKPYRVKSITLASSSLNRTINALEYNAAVYDLSAYDGVLGTLTPPLLDPSQAAIGQVQSLVVYEESYVSGTDVLNVVRASWALPIVGSYAGADIYVQINGGAFNKVASVPSAPTYVVTGAGTGDLVAVKVVAYDLWNKRASYDGAPVANHKIVGSPGKLQVADVTGANFIWSGRDCKIFWNYNSVTGSYEFGSEPDGADSGSRDPHFLDYEITVYDAGGLLLRTEHTTDNSYDYTYEKNFADGLHRRLTFHICARDIFNNVGKPCVVEAYNPPPQVVSIRNTPAFDRVQIDFTTTGDPDYAGAEIFLAWSGDVDSTVSMDPAQLAYDGPDTSVLLTNLMFNSDYQFMIAPYDAFGKSDLIPSAAFTFHTPYMDVQAIADGVLKDSQLIPELQTRIDLVDAPASVLGSVNARVNQATSSLQATISALNLTTAGAITTAVNTETTNRTTADSALGSRIDTVVATTAANGAAITSETTARANADGALSTRIDTVVAANTTNATAITSEQNARVTADSALGTRIDTVVASTSSNAALIQTETTARTTADTALGSRVDAVVATNSTNTAAIQSEQTARVAADSSMSSRIDTVVASYGADPTNLCANPVGANGTTGWSAVTLYAKTTSDVPVGAPAANVFKQNVRDNFFSGRTVDVSPGQQHYVEISAATPVSSAAAIAVGLKLITASGATTYVTAASLAATSTWTRVSGLVTIPAGYTQAQLWTQVNITGTLDSNRWYFTDAEWRPASLTQPVQASVTAETNARASADSALSTRIDTLTATVNSNTSLIQTEQSTRATADSANASSITTLQTTVGGHTTSIQAQSSSINGLSAQYTVKIDNNGYVAGYGLASYAVNGQTVSEFAVRTDTFSVNLPGYPKVHPFTIGAVYGVPRVIISSALIGDASIDNAKIGDAQITAAKIGTAQINTAHIGTAQIDTLRIGPNAVSTLAAWNMSSGSSVYYQSTGGVLTVFIQTNAGWIDTQGNVNYGNPVVRINGADVINQTAYGNFTAYTLQQPAAGTIQFTYINFVPSSPGTGLLLVFEAKR